MSKARRRGDGVSEAAAPGEVGGLDGRHGGALGARGGCRRRLDRCSRERGLVRCESDQRAFPLQIPHPRPGDFSLSVHAVIGHDKRKRLLTYGSGADVARHLANQRGVPKCLLLQLFRSRPLSDGTRGVSNAFRDQHVFSPNVRTDLQSGRATYPAGTEGVGYTNKHCSARVCNLLP
jgi:hypothetical protein